MNIERLPSGSYRVRKTVNKKKYSMTFDHKPSQREVNQRLHELIEDYKPKTPVKTFREASREYIDIKRNVLSPASIREYDRMEFRLPTWFLNMDIQDIDQKEMQRLVNEMAKELKPKTVRDRHAFCVSVIKMFLPSMDYFTTLPQKQAKIGSQAPYFPTKEDVSRILERAKGTQYEIPLKLACYGLRREEICAVLVEDLDEDNFLTINKALVQDTDKRWIVKSTKTTDSSRLIPINEELAEQIRSLPPGRIFNGGTSTIGNFLTKVEKELDIPHFSLHKMRYYFCTTLSENGISENDVLSLGGWKQNSTVMKEVYRHSNMQREKEKLKEVMKCIL